MERLDRLRELLKQKVAIDAELTVIHKQLNEESGLFKKPRKAREKKSDPAVKKTEPAPVKP
jgi:hypothetical protein